MKPLLSIVCLSILALAQVLSPASARAQQAEKPAPFELRDGDRVVLLGDDFFDREASAGYIETALTEQFPGRNVTFRNLGYAGDTVRGEARTVCEGWANFGPPQEGFDRLKTLIGQIKPTVVFVAYGMGESFEGVKALPKFVTDYGTLLDMLTEASGGKPRFVLIGPNYHENLGAPLPNPAGHNQELERYSDAIRTLAQHRDARFVDLFSATKPRPGAPAETPLTVDGIHFNGHGYWTIAQILTRELGWAPYRWSVQLTAGSTAAKAVGATVEDVKPAAAGLSFTATGERLPPPVDPSAGVEAGAQRLAVTGLSPGDYGLLSDGLAVLADSAERWAGGAAFAAGADAQRAEALRKLIVAKNVDYFRYWRHENDTYTLGYRRHEQGRNAVEFPEWVTLADASDKQIAAQRAPKPVNYVLQKAGK